VDRQLGSAAGLRRTARSCSRATRRQAATAYTSGHSATSRGRSSSRRRPSFQPSRREAGRPKRQRSGDSSSGRAGNIPERWSRPALRRLSHALHEKPPRDRPPNSPKWQPLPGHAVTRAVPRHIRARARMQVPLRRLAPGRATSATGDDWGLPICLADATVHRPPVFETSLPGSDSYVAVGRCLKLCLKSHRLIACVSDTSQTRGRRPGHDCVRLATAHCEIHRTGLLRPRGEASRRAPSPRASPDDGWASATRTRVPRGAGVNRAADGNRAASPKQVS
jgi:hypothetical protein